MGYNPKVSNNWKSETNKIVGFFDHNLYEYLKINCNTLSHNKKLPSFIFELSSNLIRVFLEKMINGDGNIHKANKHVVIYTTSKDMADDLQVLALKIGLSAKIRKDNSRINKERTGKWSHIKQKRTCYIVSFASEKSQNPLVNHGYKKSKQSKYDDDFIDYNGKIYCVTVPNEILYVRRNGIPVWCGNTHELVRHGDWTAISQRSTRYVDESECDYAWHPLVKNISDAGMDVSYLDEVQNFCKASYKKCQETLQDFLIKNNCDKFTAKKQSRGAARGILGNALSTELIFSASVAQWKRILIQRGNLAAEDEIRELSCIIFNKIQESFPDYMKDLTLEQINNKMTVKPILMSNV
jgi:hypothetical protein